MTPSEFTSLRELVLHYAAQKGWRTQRQIAVLCGLDESALSRLLNGEQDIGARRTHALFQAVGIPMERYDLAYALLGQAQASAAQTLQVLGARSATRHRIEGCDAQSDPRSEPIFGRAIVPVATRTIGSLASPDVPATVLVAYFAARRLSGQQIAAFFDAQLGD